MSYYPPRKPPTMRPAANRLKPGIDSNLLSQFGGMVGGAVPAPNPNTLLPAQKVARGPFNSQSPAQAQDLSKMFSFEQDNNVWQNANGREWDTHKILNLLLGQARDQIQYGGKLEGARQNSISQLLAQFGTGNRQAFVDAYRRRMMADAKSNARGTSMLLQSKGIDSTGAELDALNNAAQSSANFDAQMNSPEGQLQSLMAILQAIGSGQNSPALGQAMSLFGPATQPDMINAQRQQQQGGSGLASILGLIGGAGTAGGGSIFGDFLGNAGGWFK